MRLTSGIAMICLKEWGLSGASKRVEILEFGACATPFLSLRVRRGDLMEGLQRD